MIEGDGPDEERRFYQYRKHIGVVRWNRWVVLASESIFCVELCLLNPVDVKFSNFHAQGITVHKVPGIALELAVDISDESRRAVNANPFATAKSHPEQTVEADKMIHVGVCYKDMSDLQKISSGQCGYISQVEKQCPPFKKKGDEKPGI